ncbi:MAG: DUF4364 family protein [Anaerotignum sp.]|nr:DUF4364 family protein [Anaerotignum sp.]MBR6543408.1 DUF4364 family protein [Anaerotignum sp.]
MSMQYSTTKLAKNKLTIMYLLQKMGIALSNSEICQFLLEKDYMDYFSIQQYLSELEATGWLEKTQDQNNTRYTLTDDGEEVMNYFTNRISEEVKNEINTYVRENSKRIRTEYAVTANYYPELNGDFLVKCGLCDDSGATLMEISVSVVSKDQAQSICHNWRKNVKQYYRDFLFALATEKKEEPAEEE